VTFYLTKIAITLPKKKKKAVNSITPLRTNRK